LLKREETMSHSKQRPDARIALNVQPERMRADYERLRALKNFPFPRSGWSASAADSPEEQPWNIELPSAVSLIARGGRWDEGTSGIGGIEPAVPTPLLAYTPYFKEVLEQFGCPITSARISVLEPGGLIDLHSDPTESIEHGVARFHLPICTNDDVVFVIDEQRCIWKPGECWYGDFSKVHFVRNDGTEPRVHLLVTALINQRILELFPSEFIAGRDIRMYQEPLPVARESLRLFECDFSFEGKLGDVVLPALLPKAAGIDGAGRSALPARVQLLDDGLALMILNRPIFRLIPVPGDRLAFQGLPFVRLEFDRRGDQPREIERLTLDLKFDSVVHRLPLPLRPAAPASAE
jgi:hypothetical protein